HSKRLSRSSNQRNSNGSVAPHLLKGDTTLVQSRLVKVSGLVILFLGAMALVQSMPAAPFRPFNPPQVILSPPPNNGSINQAVGAGGGLRGTNGIFGSFGMSGSVGNFGVQGTSAIGGGGGTGGAVGGP